jgi:hypothetical protein
MHRWAALAAQFAGRVSRLLNRPVEASVAFRITSHGSIRRELPEPGLLVPVGTKEDEAFLRFDPGCALLLTGLLLGDQEGLAMPERPSVLDGVAMTAIAEPLAAVLEEGFGLHLAPDLTRPHAEEWALTQPSAGDRLLATFELSMGAERASFDLLFPPIGPEILERWAAQTQEGPRPSDVALDASFLLCRWKSDGRSLAGIVPGAQITLPGADLTRIKLEVETGGTLRSCASGTVVTRRGRREMTVGEVLR